MKEDNDKFYLVVIGILIFVIIFLWITRTELKESANECLNKENNIDIDENKDWKEDYENVKVIAETLLTCYENNLPYYSCKKLIKTTNFTPKLEDGSIILIPND